MILDDWQKEALNHQGNLLLCTGRQVGKTTIMAMKAAERMMKVPKTKIIIVSLTEDQAKLIIVMILDYLEKTYPREIARGKLKPTQNKVSLKNGSSSLARPVGITGDAMRGFTGSVLVIDEASRMPELVWSAAKPVLMTTAGEIWMCSTPFGKQGYFWEMYEKCELKKTSNRFKVIHTSSEQVIHDRKISADWTEHKREEAIKFLEEEKKDMTELQYGQEYLGLFLDDLRQFFPDDLIEKCCILKRSKSYGGKKYLGVDIARMGDDESTFEIITDFGEPPFIHQENIITKKTFTTETERRIQDLAKIWNTRKIGIDAGAGTLGVSILDHLMETNLRNKVVALNNRSIALDSEGKKKQALMKEDMYCLMKMLMERGELKLLDDTEIFLSLKSVQYEYAKSSRGTAQMKIFGQYTHIAEGLIRAVWLAKKEKTLNLWAA